LLWLKEYEEPGCPVDVLIEYQTKGQRADQSATVGKLIFKKWKKNLN